jgi:hypothetical protein
MTNITRRKILVTHHEVSIPVREGGATRRDVADLLFFADQKYEEVHGVKADHDDAYLIEPRDDEMVAVIKERQPLP